MQPGNPFLRSIYLFATDVDESVSFNELLGLSIERVGDHFARALEPGGILLEIGDETLTRSYYPGWEEPRHPGKNTINFEFPSGGQVDATYQRLVAAGYVGALAPTDPPWQARFALVYDPDGNLIGLHGPRHVEEDRLRERNHD